MNNGGGVVRDEDKWTRFHYTLHLCLGTIAITTIAIKIPMYQKHSFFTEGQEKKQWDTS
jgi:hypothetical protein